MSTSSIIDLLSQRGLIQQQSDLQLAEIFKTPQKVYVGFDPTADSLHVGNLMAIILLKWFQLHGHTPIILMGGATGKIGDPSGKSTERPLLAQSVIEKNIASIEKTFQKILRFDGPNGAKIVNNATWLDNYPLIDFLRDVGKYFRVGAMLSKESVRGRIESEEGISFTEFSYQLLQGYDFFHLFTKEHVILQMGGSDQWGNITAGIEFIRKLTPKEGSSKGAFGLVYPILTDENGKKFGKSEKGALWLNKEKFPVFQLYQFFLKTSDQQVIQLLKFLTFLSLEEIASYEMKLKEHPNLAQKRLAYEITSLVHGKEEADLAVEQSEKLYQKEISSSSWDELAEHFTPISIKKEVLTSTKLIDFLVENNIVHSKAEVRRLLQNQGIRWNDGKVTEDALFLNEVFDVHQGIISVGKSKKFLIKIEV